LANISPSKYMFSRTRAGRRGVILSYQGEQDDGMSVPELGRMLGRSVLIAVFSLERSKDIDSEGIGMDSQV
jgi:hypothetical protein